MDENKTYIVHINGYPGTGKLTVAKELCAMGEQFKLMDNHLTANPIFLMVRDGSGSPLPKPVWDAVDDIRQIVLKFMRSHANPTFHFVFTNCMYETPKEQAYLDHIRAVANTRGSIYVPVVITCDVEENKKRVVLQDRKDRLKMSDPDYLETIRDDLDLLYHDDKNLLVFDNTDMSPQDAAKKIYDHALSL